MSGKYTTSTTCTFYAKVQELNRIVIPTDISNEILDLQKGEMVEASIRRTKRRLRENL